MVRRKGLYNELCEYILALKLRKVTTVMYSLICNVHKSNMYNCNRQEGRENRPT